MTSEPERQIGPAAGRTLALCAGLLCTIALAWLAIGGTFLARRLPHMDAIAYQEEACDVLWGWRERGFPGALAQSFVARHAAHSALHRVATVAIAPFVPFSRSVLYVELWGAQLVALFALCAFLHRRTRSPGLALLGPALYLTAWPFGTIDITGVLEQSLDLTSAAFALLAFMAAWRWMERPSTSRALVTGLVLGAAVLHRSICAMQLAIMLVTIVGLALHARAVSRRRLLLQSSFAIVVALAIVLPWYAPYAGPIARYYGSYSYAVGKPMSLWEAGAASLRHVATAFWGGAWIVLAAIAILAAIAKTLHGRAAIAIAAAFASPLVPLVLTRSEVIEPTYPTLALLGLAPLMILDAGALATRNRWLEWAPGLLAAGVASVALAHLSALARQVDSLSPDPRIHAERMLDSLAREVPQRPLAIAGFTVEPVSAMGLASTMRIEHRMRAIAGPEPVVEHDFFLPVRQPCDGERCWERVPEASRRAAHACALERIVASSHALLVVQPEGIDRFHPALVFYGQVHMRELAAAVDADPRFERRGIDEIVGGVPLRIYAVRAGARADLQLCCSPLLVPNRACGR